MTASKTLPQRIQSDDDARRIAGSIGFTWFMRVATRDSALEAFRHLQACASTNKRSGVYLHIYTSGTLYIGQSINILTRFDTHRRLGHLDDVQWVAFLPCPASRCIEKEAELIARADRLGLPLLNRSVRGGEPLALTGLLLDELFPPAAQDDFIDRVLERAAALSLRGRLATLVRSAPEKELEGWRTLSAHPKAERILAFARRVRRIALPELTDTFAPLCADDIEFNWWIATTNKKNDYPTVQHLSITVGRRTLLECFSYKTLPETVYARLTLAPEPVTRGAAAEKLRQKLLAAAWYGPEPGTLKTPEALHDPKWSPVFGRIYPNDALREKDIRRAVTRAGMEEPVGLLGTLDFMEAALSEPLVMRALALEALAAMRFSLVLKPENHNRLVAEAIRSAESARVLLANVR